MFEKAETFKKYNHDNSIKPAIKFDNLDRFNYQKTQKFSSGFTMSNGTSIDNPLITNMKMSN